METFSGDKITCSCPTPLKRLVRPKNKARRLWRAFRLLWVRDASELFDQLGHSGEEVGNEAIVCDLEDRCLFVLVDGNDDF